MNVAIINKYIFSNSNQNIINVKVVTPSWASKSAWVEKKTKPQKRKLKKKRKKKKNYVDAEIDTGRVEL